jgi:hypothetical protein
VLNAAGKVQRQVRSGKAGLRCEVLADHAVIVIVRRTIMPMFVPAGVGITLRSSFIRMMMMMMTTAAAAVVMVATFSNTVRMKMAVAMQQVHSAMADERNAAINGKQAQANEALNTGQHRSTRQRRRQFGRRPILESSNADCNGKSAAFTGSSSRHQNCATAQAPAWTCRPLTKT